MTSEGTSRYDSWGYTEVRRCGMVAASPACDYVALERLWETAVNGCSPDSREARQVLHLALVAEDYLTFLRYLRMVCKWYMHHHHQVDVFFASPFLRFIKPVARVCSL